MRKAVFLALLFLLGGFAEQGSAQSRLEEEEDPEDGNQTAPENETQEEVVPVRLPTGKDPLLFITDDIRFGFTSNVEDGYLKHMTQHFLVYVNPHNETGPWYLQVLLDGRAVKLSNGDTRAVFEGEYVEYVNTTNARNMHLVIKLTLDGTSEPITYDFGDVRLRTMSSVRREIEDKESVVEQQLRYFTQAELTMQWVAWGLVGLASIVFGLYGGILRGREKEMQEEPMLVAA